VPNHYTKINKSLKEHWTGLDKLGRPIKVQQFQDVSEKTVFSFALDIWWKWNFMGSEELIHVILPYCSQIAETRINQAVIVCDLGKVDLSPVVWSSEVRKY